MLDSAPIGILARTRMFLCMEYGSSVGIEHEIDSGNFLDCPLSRDRGGGARWHAG